MDLAPINASTLTCREEDKGKLLTVLDLSGSVVARGTLGKLADPAYAVVETADDRWRIEHVDRRQLVVLDAAGNAVATVGNGKVILADGETLAWKWSGPLRDRFQLGDIWESRRQSKRRFCVHLARGMLAREDRCLLTGLAAILVQDIMRRRRKWAFTRYIGI